MSIQLDEKQFIITIMHPKRNRLEALSSQRSNVQEKPLQSNEEHPRIEDHEKQAPHTYGAN